MTNTHSADERSGSDLWVAAGVVLFLGIGASMTYWLTSTAPAPQPTGPVQGALMNAPVPDGKPGLTGDAAKAPGVPAIETATDVEFPKVTFETLSSYYYAIPDMEDVTQDKSKMKDQIPQPIKELNGKKVAVQGFMMPIKQEKGGVRTFLLVRDQSICCFGRTPRMNEWVSVKMNGDKTARFIGDQPVTVFGVLQVGEHIEKGVVLSVYRLDADDVAGPLDL
jgi:hypothetical protein